MWCQHDPSNVIFVLFLAVEKFVTKVCFSLVYFCSQMGATLKIKKFLFKKGIHEGIYLFLVRWVLRKTKKFAI